MIELEWLGDRGTKRPLVIVPGIDGSRGSVDPIADILGTGRAVAVVNYSQEKECSLDNLSRAIAIAISGDVSGEFYLMGQSIGTLIAAKIAAAEPRASRLILVSTFTSVRDFALRLSSFLSRHSPQWLYSLTSRPALILSCGPVGDGWHHPFFRYSANSDQRGVARRTYWQIGKDFSEVITAPTQPMLVLMGENDRFVPNAARQMAKLRTLLKGREAILVSIPKAGHVFLPSRAIKRAAELIEEFLK